MVQKMLQVIHELEPSGVGHKIYRMLAVTIKTQNSPESVELAIIIENQFDAFTKTLRQINSKYGV
jgi:RNA polymerase sigma-54 factor